MRGTASRFRSDSSGSAATVFAIALPILLVGGGLASDYAAWSSLKAEMQAAADAAALGAARERGLPGRTTEQVLTVARAIADAQLGGAQSSASHTTRPELVGDSGVRVALSQPGGGQFGRLLGVEPPLISVSATATVTGRRKPCVIVLEPAAAEAMHMKSNAKLTARDCMVQVNSKSAQAFVSDSGITLTAALTCASGGMSGQGRIVGQRLTDCPPLADPLAGRPAPAVHGGCDRINLRVELNNSAGNRHTLSPGVYCGGLFIGANSFVRFDPGIYVIKDGPLVLDSNADVTGKHVGFHLVGSKAVLDFTSNAKVSLDAPRDGALAGILMFEDRNAPALREHRITSNFATNMTGTIYFPRGRFVVDASNEVARHSAYTVIIARQVLLTASPVLVLNSDYGMTDVPLPAGIAGGDKVRLER